MRTMYDAIYPANIPTDAQMVAGYIDGRWAWTAAEWALFPNAVKVRIAVFPSTNDGHCLDIEPGDATPAQGPAWVVMRRNAGVDPSVYCNTATWPAVRAAFAAAQVAEPHYWIAAYPGNGPNLYPGSVAHQYANPGPVDISVVADYWPGVDPAPTASARPTISPPTAATIDPFQEDPMDRLIIACYRDLVGREPSATEVDGWLISAAQGNWAGRDLTARFLASRAEYGTAVKAYADFLGRVPTPAEAGTWSDGETVQQVRDGVANSPEAKARKGK